MPGKSRSKLKNKILIIFIIIFLLLLSITIANYFIPGFGLKLPFIYNTKSSHSEIILKEIHKISNLSTVEYIYKSVFPFDFIDTNTNWKKLLSKKSKNEYLTELQQDELWIYNQCKSIGINLEYDIYDFVVITSIVKAGFNLEDKITSHDIVVEGKNITLKIPNTIITKFTIEDPDSTNYKYPDLDVNPQQWKQITNFVEKKIRIKVLEDGILKNAEKRGQDFIKSILLESGWENVIFIQ